MTLLLSIFIFLATCFIIHVIGYAIQKYIYRKNNIYQPSFWEFQNFTDGVCISLVVFVICIIIAFIDKFINWAF